jgi:hypothetical protein
MSDDATMNSTLTTLLEARPPALAEPAEGERRRAAA